MVVGELDIQDKLKKGQSIGWPKNMWLFVPAQVFTRQWLETFREFAPRQIPAKFNIDDVMAIMQKAAAR